MKLYYLLRYIIFLLVAHYIHILGIPSIFQIDFSSFLVIPFGFLSVRFGIQRPVELRKDINYKNSRPFFSGGLFLFNTIIIRIAGANLIPWLLFNFSSITTLIFFQPSYEKLKVITEKNIQEYFENK